MRGFLDSDPARPFVALATQNKEVVQFSTDAGLSFYGTVNPDEINYPGQYVSRHGYINVVITTVGQVVDGVITTVSEGSQYAISYQGYETLNLIGSPPNRQYEPYTPQFVDL